MAARKQGFFKVQQKRQILGKYKQFLVEILSNIRPLPPTVFYMEI